MNLTVDDRICHLVPVYNHVGQALVWACIGSGSVSIVPGPVFDAEETLKIIQNEKCTILFSDPLSLKALLEHPKFTKVNLSTLQKVVVDLSGTSSTEQIDAENLKQTFGVKTVIVITKKDLAEGTPIEMQSQPPSPFDIQ